jgi:hypothetical protein
MPSTSTGVTQEVGGREPPGQRAARAGEHAAEPGAFLQAVPARLVSALAVELESFLSCASEGHGQGAIFTSELPIVGEESRA